MMKNFLIVALIAALGQSASLEFSKGVYRRSERFALRYLSCVIDRGVL